MLSPYTVDITKNEYTAGANQYLLRPHFQRLFLLCIRHPLFTHRWSYTIHGRILWTVCICLSLHFTYSVCGLHISWIYIYLNAHATLSVVSHFSVSKLRFGEFRIEMQYMVIYIHANINIGGSIIAANRASSPNRNWVQFQQIVWIPYAQHSEFPFLFLWPSFCSVYVVCEIHLEYVNWYEFVSNVLDRFDIRWWKWMYGFGPIWAARELGNGGGFRIRRHKYDSIPCHPTAGYGVCITRSLQVRARDVASYTNTRIERTHKLKVREKNDIYIMYTNVYLYIFHWRPSERLWCGGRMLEFDMHIYGTLSAHLNHRTNGIYNLFI